ncbi:MAG: DUF421 domain-containing protein [Acidimicrobiales bacterium]
MFFDSWAQMGRVPAVGVLAYVALLVLLRLSGKRTLAKLNAFDLVATVALGSTLATILLSSDVSLLEGIAAFAVLVGAQLAVAWSSTRAPIVRRLVKAEPTLLVHDGQILADRLRQHRVVVEEVRQAVRASGVGDLALVAAVVLETDGSLSVVTQSQKGCGDALAGVAVPGRSGDGPG